MTTPAFPAGVPKTPVPSFIVHPRDGPATLAAQASLDRFWSLFLGRMIRQATLDGPPKTPVDSKA